MPEFITKLDIGHYLAFSIAFFGWTFGFVQLRIANKHKKESAIFDKRLSIYNEYFQKLDQINDRLMIDAKEFMGDTMQSIYKGILQDPENITEHLIELNSKFSEITAKASKNMNQAFNEISTLRFIATKRTLAILNEYRALGKMQQESLSKVIGSIDLRNGGAINPEYNQELIDIGNKLIETKDKLEAQMRKDLNV
jgi:hypothetical protein